MTTIINDEASRVRTQVQSQPGRALTFDGVNDYVDCGSASPLQLSSGEWTISYWKRSTIAIEGTASCGTAAWIISDARFYYLGAWRNWAIGEPLNDGWNYYTFTFSSGTLKRYINGALDQSLTGVTGSHGAGGSVRIGNYGGTFLTGQMHDFRIYNRALTASEISNLYNATKQSGGDIAGTLYAANLVGWWPLEEINISSIRDASGNDYHGTQSGTVSLYTGADVPSSIKNELGYTLNAGEEYYADASDLTKDIQGNALGYPGPLAKRALPKASPCATFDGVNDFASIESTDFQFTGDYSVSAWIKLSALQVGRIAGRHETTGWQLRVEASGKLSLWRDPYAVESLLSLATGTWYHVVGTAEGNSVKLYINGVLDNTGTLSASTHSAPVGTELRIGRHGTGYLAGQLADVRVFNRALTPTEVASIYAGNIVTSGLLAHWPMSEGSLVLLNDISGNGHNAVASGMTSNELWANTQDVYHESLRGGIRTTFGRRGYRYLNGSSQYFTAADSTSPEIGGDVPFFVTATVRPGSVAAGAGVIASKYDGGSNAKSFMLYRSGADVVFGISSNGVAFTEVTVAGALTVGVTSKVVAYHDPVANLIGLSVNGVAFTTAAYSSGIFNAASSVKVGAAETASFLWNGDIFNVGICLPPVNPSSWTAIRDAYGIGTTYEDLTSTQITDWGVLSWYDCDEWGPQLRDKHADDHLTGTGYSADYPLPAVPALLTAPTRPYATLSKSLTGSSFNGGNLPQYACGAGQKMWVAAYVRIRDYSATGAGIASKYSGTTEWLLFTQISTSINTIYFTQYDSAGVNVAQSLVGPVGEWIFLFGYIDATTGTALGLSMNGDSFVTASSANGPRSTTDNFQIGNFFSANQLEGDVAHVAIGKGPLLTFSQVRDLLYGSGQPLAFGDLTTADKTSIGLVEWFDCGEYDGTNVLVGKHADLSTVGNAMPSTITHGGPGTIPPVATAIDFTGNVAAPWTDTQYLGYLACSGAASGRVVTQATVGKFVDGNVSLFVRIRNMPTGSYIAFFDSDNGSGGSRSAFAYNQAADKFSIYDTAYRDIGPAIGAAFRDGNWHDVLFSWQGAGVKLYIDNVLWGQDPAGLSSITSRTPNWTRSTILAVVDLAGQNFIGDIARLVVADGIRVPGNILTAPNLLDLRFDSPNCEDEQGRIPSSAWLSGHTPKKLTVPTAYKHGVILPEGMDKSASALSERQFRVFKKDQ
jgi:hypothetical protein